MAAPRPRCALAGVAANEATIAATATKATNDFFMSWAPEDAPGGAGFKVTHTPYTKMIVSLKKRTPVNAK
jgi:hypothetical protein